MNLSEYELLSKEDIFKMYENVCEELEVMEGKLQSTERYYKEAQDEINELEDRVYALNQEIETLENAFDDRVED